MRNTGNALTVDQLAARTGIPDRLAGILTDDLARGMVEHHADGYRLTATAEASYGKSLRAFGPPDNRSRRRDGGPVAQPETPYRPPVIQSRIEVGAPPYHGSTS